jgi:hypothetical protein
MERQPKRILQVQDIPSDVWQEIFRFLDSKVQLVRIAAVCTTWRQSMMILAKKSQWVKLNVAQDIIYLPPKVLQLMSRCSTNFLALQERKKKKNQSKIRIISQALFIPKVCQRSKLEELCY